jgi:hypothetical protein
VFEFLGLRGPKSLRHQFVQQQMQTILCAGFPETPWESMRKAQFVLLLSGHSGRMKVQFIAEPSSGIPYQFVETRGPSSGGHQIGQSDNYGTQVYRNWVVGVMRIDSNHAQQADSRKQLPQTTQLKARTR